jgi:hypothetical protein
MTGTEVFGLRIFLLGATILAASVAWMMCLWLRVAIREMREPGGHRSYSLFVTWLFAFALILMAIGSATL